MKYIVLLHILWALQKCPATTGGHPPWLDREEIPKVGILLPVGQILVTERFTHGSSYCIINPKVNTRATMT